MTLSRHQISEYYSDPKVRMELVSQLKDNPAMVIQSLPAGNVVHRNRSGAPIRITRADLKNDPHSLRWFTDRRFSEFHPVIGEKTNKGWVDIDPGPGRTIESVKPLVSDVANALSKLPNVRDVSISYSGGRGFHVRTNFESPQGTDDARNEITDFLKDKFKQRDVVFTKPHAGQVRLDTSTLKNKGSIRALYSLNSETGRVALPLTPEGLKKFKPEDTDVETILKQREFAPGIPGSRRTHALPEKIEKEDWTLAVQEHNAHRAGKHWDLRLIDPHTGFAHSWAVPRAKFPELDSKPVLAIQTPTHTSEYALNFGAKGPEKIREGYGKGTVEIKHKEPVKMLSISPDKIKFRRIIGNSAEEYMLFRTRDNAWLLRNATQTKKASVVFHAGFADILTKLGLASGKAPGKVMQQLSTSEGATPLEVNDEHATAGQLAAALSQIPDEESRTRTNRHRHQSAEDRMNRNTGWDSPTTVPSHFMDGPTPLVTRGAGFI